MESVLSVQPQDVILNSINEGVFTVDPQWRITAEAFRRHQGNRKRADRNLGIDASTLYRKLKSLNMEPPATDGRSRPR